MKIFPSCFASVTFYKTNESFVSFVLQIIANDSDCGVNAKVNYTLGEETGRLKEFQIKSDTGEICVAEELDYERRKSYEFPVIASDRGKLNECSRFGPLSGFTC